MSVPEPYAESEPEPLSPSASAAYELSSSGSDSDTVETLLNKRRLSEKRPSQPSSSKRIRDDGGRERNGASSSLAAAEFSRSSPNPPLGAEVMSALKEITSLLNSVVERVERVEDEMHRQRSTGPSTSSDSTPTRANFKPPLVVKVSQCCK